MKVIAVTSLKGGTGKSTVSISLANALLAKGKTVGLLDLDFTSPCSQILAKPTTAITVDAQNGFTPAQTADGLEVFSIGLLTEEETPMLLRGAKKGEIAMQLTEDIKWGSPDYLVVDFPSGIQEQTLAILRNMKPNKTILVVQPDQLSISSAKRMLKALRIMKVNITGIIENMGSVKCPKCGNTIDLFKDNVRELAKKMKVKFLGSIPFYPELNRNLPLNDEILERVM